MRICDLRFLLHFKQRTTSYLLLFISLPFFHWEKRSNQKSFHHYSYTLFFSVTMYCTFCSIPSFQRWATWAPSWNHPLYWLTECCQENIIKNKISCQLRNTLTKEQKEKFYYGVNLKSECDAYHGSLLKRIQRQKELLSFVKPSRYNSLHTYAQDILVFKRMWQQHLLHIVHLKFT